MSFHLKYTNDNWSNETSLQITDFVLNRKLHSKITESGVTLRGRHYSNRLHLKTKRLITLSADFFVVPNNKQFILDFWKAADKRYSDDGVTWTDVVFDSDEEYSPEYIEDDEDLNFTDMDDIEVSIYNGPFDSSSLAKEITAWKHLPLDEVQFFYQDGNPVDEFVRFRNFRSAEWDITEIRSKKKDANGYGKVVALKLKGSFEILENKFDSMHTISDFMRGGNPENIYIRLEGNQRNKETIAFDFKGDSNFKKFKHETFYINQGENSLFRVEFEGKFHKNQIRLNPTYT